MKCSSCGRELDAAGACPGCDTPFVAAAVELEPGGAARRPEAARRFLPGTMLAGRYRIIHVLGQGGMGEVYHADDLVLGQEVALKFLPRALETYLAQLLLHEVRIARQITHPNVCRVYDIGQAEGLRFLSMEYIDGENLASLLRRVGRLSPERAVVLGVEICRGLAAVHDKGILHRDLKPANLMIDSAGRARITDFGLAALAGSVLARQVRHGTPAYMAPEQAAGDEVTLRSDLYALGLVLWELLTGERWPEDGAPSPVEGLDPEAERRIRQCLAEDPAARPASAREVAAALGEGAVPLWQPGLGATIPQRPNWVLERELGRGGFGHVWLAVHAKTRERRVFKFCDDNARLSALQREITLFRLLREELGERDDIVRLLDWNLDDPPWFIESELTDGGDLLEWSASRGGIHRVPLAVRLEIAAQVAETLAAAHSVGVLHKDIKPANVLIRDTPDGPRIRVADFGIGRVLDASRLDAAGITRLGLSRTGAGASSGTLLYRAPELFEGKPATVQADVYSLGVLLYQLTVGDLGSVLGSGWEHDVDDELLREEIAAAVDRSPQRRLADAAVLAARLRSLEERRQRRGAERRRREEAERHRRVLERALRRRRLQAAVLGVALLVISLLLFHAVSTTRSAARQQDLLRVAVGGEWLTRDPTRAALVLLEIGRPDRVPFAVHRIRQALQHKLALFELRHADAILSAAWNPAGSRLLTASEDGVLRLSGSDGRGPPTQLQGCDGTLTSAVWSPGGERVATTCWNGRVEIWRPGAGGDRPARTLRHPTPVLAAAWSPAGDRLATTADDGTVRIWDLAAGPVPNATARLLRGHAAAVTAAAWSADGRRLATASQDGTARVWDLAATPPGVQVLEHDRRRRVWTVAWHPAGDRLVTASNDATARVWRVDPSPGGAALLSVLEGHSAAVRAASWSGDGEWILTASQDRTARVWSAAGEPAAVLEGHELALRVAAWSPGTSGSRPRWILTASEDGTARVWPFAAGQVRGEPVLFGRHDFWVAAAGWRPDGEQIVTVSGTAARVWPAGPSLREIGSGEPRRLDHPAAARSAKWHPSGERVVTVAADGRARLWELGGGEPTVLEGPQRFTAAAFDPAGERLAIAATDGTVRIWPARALPAVAGSEGAVSAPRVFAGHGATVVAIAWSGDGQRLVSAAGHVARVWRDGATPAAVLGGHRALVRAVAWSGDDRRIVTASDDGTARIWPADGAGPEVVLDHGATTPVRTAAFSPSGERVVTGLLDGRVRLWRADGAAAPIDLEGHHFAVNSVAFSPDGEWILTASSDSTAKIRRADGTAEPIVLEGHGGRVEDAAWSPGGERIVTASRDGTARVWTFPTRDLTALLRASTAVCLTPEFRRQTLGDPAAEAHYHECERSYGRTGGPGGG